MSDLQLSDVELAGIEEYPADSSVKLYGPPGTGKTTNAAGRVARLIESYDYSISDVTWATYRRSLALDTLERLVEWGIIDPSQLEKPSEGATRYISTFHAIGSRLSDGLGSVAGRQHHRAFAEERNLRWGRKRRWQESPGELLFNVFQYCAENFIDPDNRSQLQRCPYIDELRQSWRGNVGKAWTDWKEYKQAEGLIDFYEQLQVPLREGHDPGNPILVIDEYHDAYPLMAALAKQWIGTAKIVIVAGDPDQVVNAYAGADPAFFRELDLPEVLLDTTYRVPNQHWNLASQILENRGEPAPPVERISEGPVKTGNSPPFTYNTQKERWTVPTADDAQSPTWFVEEYGEDTMFLVRTGKQGDGVARALETDGVLFTTQGSIQNPGWSDREDGMSERVALYNALQKLHGLTQADVRAGHGLSQWQDSGQSVDSVQLAAEEAAAILDHTNYRYLVQDRDETTDIAENLVSKEKSVAGPDLAAYVTPEWWDLYTRGPGAVRHLNKSSNRTAGRDLNKWDTTALGRAIERNSGPVGDVRTKVYTIHAAKGGEAENVVAYDGITSRIRKGMDRSESTARNEWRTWYVALTRAKKRLFILNGGFEWVRPIVSPLIAAKGAVA